MIQWKPKVSANGRIEHTIVEDKKVKDGVKNRDSKIIEAKKVEEDEDLLHKMEEQR